MNGARGAPNFIRICALCALPAFGSRVSAQADPLSSWNDGAAKQAIVEFVQTTATQGWIVISVKDDCKKIFAFE
jgi:hypothetical protein